MTLTALFIVFSLAVMSATGGLLACRMVADLRRQDEPAMSAVTQAVVATCLTIVLLVPFYCLLVFVFRVLPLMDVL